MIIILSINSCYFLNIITQPTVLCTLTQAHLQSTIMLVFVGLDDPTSFLAKQANSPLSSLAISSIIKEFSDDSFQVMPSLRKVNTELSWGYPSSQLQFRWSVCPSKMLLEDSWYVLLFTQSSVDGSSVKCRENEEQTKYISCSVSISVFFYWKNCKLI